jgi:hypothetical protein
MADHESGTSGGAETQPNTFVRTEVDYRRWVRTHGVTMLDRLLDDCQRYLDLHAEISGQDHFGHVAERVEALRRFDDQRAEMRAADPERSRRARRWADQVVRESARRQARRPREAGPADFARALSTAVNHAAALQQAGQSVPAPARLVADVADQSLFAEPADQSAFQIGIIVLPSSDDDLARYSDDRDTVDEQDDASPPVPPLPAPVRAAAAAQTIGLLTGCIRQIELVLTLMDSADHPGEPTTVPAGVPGPSDRDPAALLGIGVEIARLRSAQATRRHERTRRLFEQAMTRHEDRAP